MAPLATPQLLEDAHKGSSERIPNSIKLKKDLTAANGKVGERKRINPARAKQIQACRLAYQPTAAFGQAVIAGACRYFRKAPFQLFRHLLTPVAPCKLQVVLLEFLEQRPLLLGRPGMCTRLVTYYKKASEADTGHLALMGDKEGDGRRAHQWRVGQVQALAPSDSSPFLGPLLPEQKVIN